MHHLTPLMRTLGLLAVGLLLSLPVNATPVTWTLNNIVLDQLLDSAGNPTTPALSASDYLNITGSFSFDNANLDSSNPNITISGFDLRVTDSSHTELYHYTLADFDAYYVEDPSTLLPSLNLLAKDSNNNDVLILEFSSDLVTGTSATLTYALYSVGSAPTAVQYVTSAAQAVNGGASSVSNVSAVPLPAAAWLFGSGLLGFVGMSRRRRP